MSIFSKVTFVYIQKFKVYQQVHEIFTDIYWPVILKFLTQKKKNKTKNTSPRSTHITLLVLSEYRLTKGLNHKRYNKNKKFKRKKTYFSCTNL